MSESSYHGRMMNIRRSEDDAREASSAAPHMAAAYAYGHRDARHAAAEIALEADARIARLEARFAEMWRIATEAAFANENTRCCFCNTPQGRLHEADCALNAWQMEGSDE